MEATESKSDGVELAVVNPMHHLAGNQDARTTDLAIVDPAPAASDTKRKRRCPSWLFGLPMCFAAGCITWSGGLVAINLVASWADYSRPETSATDNSTSCDAGYELSLIHI